MRRWRSPLAALGLLCAAAAQAGEPRAIDARWLRWQLDFETAVDQTLPLAALAKGIRGQALRSGGPQGTQVSVAGRGRVDLTQPGAFEIWICPELWRAAAGREYIPFVSIHTPDGQFFTIERDRDRDTRGADRLLAGYWGLRRGLEFSVGVPLPSDWRPESWHSLAVSWDETGFAVSVDGGAWVTRAVPLDLAAEGFTPARTQLVIGSAGSEVTRLDSFRVFSRAIH